MRKKKVAPLPGSLSTQIVPPKRSRMWALIANPETGPLRLVDERVAGLAEPLEDLLVILLGNAGAIVAHADQDRVRFRARFNGDQATVLVAELYGVGDQIDDHLRDAVRVHEDFRQVLRCASRARCAGFSRTARRLQRVRWRLSRRLDFDEVPVRVAGLHLGQVEDVVDQPRQTVGFLHDDVQEFLSLFDGYVRIVVHDLAEGADRGERRPNSWLMVETKSSFILSSFPEALVGGPELGRRGPSCDFSSSWRL